MPRVPCTRNPCVPGQGVPAWYPEDPRHKRGGGTYKKKSLCPPFLRSGRSSPVGSASACRPSGLSETGLFPRTEAKKRAHPATHVNNKIYTRCTQANLTFEGRKQGSCKDTCTGIAPSPPRFIWPSIWQSLGDGKTPSEPLKPRDIQGLKHVERLLPKKKSLCPPFFLLAHEKSGQGTCLVTAPFLALDLPICLLQHGKALQFRFRDICVRVDQADFASEELVGLGYVIELERLE
ncbi:hypothetical protein Sinac_7446 [Singulisphaera acidiphila DSM 18658]|uniref:Uncharacterized protein n=1 Tax=Singulisphaera acidiphila (strain ATCC BAA-1392 / DSM 18658 / VKM B-2454 / MOB10) TaxID=886293 RepID=L0DSZ0_SINAD|nr:hypothetical protein Sinac_7446 [Singulisphaera acidiphila DSM 18658]